MQNIEVSLECGKISNGCINGRIIDTEDELAEYLREHSYSSGLSELRSKFSVVAVIDNIFIDPIYRGEGLAYDLVEKFINKALVYGAEAVIVVKPAGLKSFNNHNFISAASTKNHL